MRALITGTSTFFAARLIQGFASAGVELTAADERWLSVGWATRRARRHVITPSLSRDPGGYLAAIVGELEARPYDLVVPTFEEALLLAEFRDRLERHARLFLPPFDVMWRLHHKPSLYRLCRELEIPAPWSVMPATPLGLELQVAGLKFPVVVKLPAANNCVGRAFCDTMPELVERYTELAHQERLRGASPPFVQEKIDGDAIYTLMLCNQGRKLGEVIYRPLRTYPEAGGTSAHRESIDHPRIAALTERLAAATGWSGFLGLDFLVDRIDGTPYLIDANPRSNPAIHLGYLAGVDWSGMLIDLAAGRAPTPMFARAGVRNRTPLLDIGWLLEGMRPGRRWFDAAAKRYRDYLRPEWSLDAEHDFDGTNSPLFQLTQVGQGLTALFRSLLTGTSLGQAILEDANYDPVSVEQLRGPAPIGTAQPAALPAA